MHSAPITNEITAECPCVGHCTTALGDEVCRSCHRTFEEVTRWPELTDAERIEINRRIAHAQASLEVCTPSLTLPWKERGQK